MRASLREDAARTSRSKTSAQAVGGLSMQRLPNESLTDGLYRFARKAPPSLKGVLDAP